MSVSQSVILFQVFDRSRYRVRITEDASYPTELLTVHASDRDLDTSKNSRIQYSLLTKTDQFLLNSTSGVLTLIAQLDRERSSSYQLKVFLIWNF